MIDAIRLITFFILVVGFVYNGYRMNKSLARIEDLLERHDEDISRLQAEDESSTES